jgi:hypothetical protein
VCVCVCVYTLWQHYSWTQTGCASISLDSNWLSQHFSWT